VKILQLVLFFQPNQKPLFFGKELLNITKEINAIKIEENLF
jgi:hypothetical protein